MALFSQSLERRENGAVEVGGASGKLYGNAESMKIFAPCTIFPFKAMRTNSLERKKSKLNAMLEMIIIIVNLLVI